MNIENDFLTDFDLFGKTPEFYYKGRSKKSSTFGIILSVIYIVLYIAFLLYKLIRMFKRIDLTFYDSYTFNGLPSINLTNNVFYGGFGMGGLVDERMYYLKAFYITKVKENGQLVEKSRIPLETEICKLEWFGSEYQELFSDQPMHNYYCIKDLSEIILEGYSNLERFSYFNVIFYPCVGKTKDGRECYNYKTKEDFFTQNIIQLKIQDNDLNPEDYKTPVIRRLVDMNSPVFKELFQLIYSYFQIVNIETDEDITGLNFFTDHIRKQVYTRYDGGFIIAHPPLYGDILRTGGPIADVTIQLAAKVLTEKRQYTQLIDVLGDVGGLMEILYSFLNIISSFVTEILYDKSLVNNLFSFDINKRYVVFNKAKNKIRQINENNKIQDLNKVNTIKLKEKFQDLENNKNIDIFSKENSVEQSILAKSGNSLAKKKVIKVIKKKKKPKNPASKATNLFQLKQQNTQNEHNPNNENKSSLEEKKTIVSINNMNNEDLGNTYDNIINNEKDLKNISINHWLIYCYWCISKKNLNKILFEEGSKIITERLDIMNMFNNLYTIEVIQKKLGIEAKGMNMSNNCINSLKI